MKGKLPIQLLDIVMIFLSLGLTGFSAFISYAKPRNTSQVLIQGQDRRWVFPQDADETVTVPGPLGDTIVRIHENQAWVVSSPCDNQMCVGAGHVHSQGDWVACLPNNVFLVIEGSDDFKNLTDVNAW
ncbi:hypothetical protein AGMMS50293_30970 [Spirochaetia bacterium]|nr:hypothetical protein AGMMS50293_30970 [Spirochaetia bacterium]